MKRSLIIPALLAAGVLVSCSQASEDENNFKIVYTSSKEFALPGKTDSCLAIANAYQSSSTSGTAPVADIEPLYFTIRNPEIWWYDKKKTMNVSLITVTISSPALSANPYTCQIGGDEMRSLFGIYVRSNSGVTLLPWDGNLPYVNPITSASQNFISASPAGGSTVIGGQTVTWGPICGAIKCGGIKLADGVTRFSGTAVVKVQGVATDTDGSQSPVYIQNTLTIQN